MVAKQIIELYGHDDKKGSMQGLHRAKYQHGLSYVYVKESSLSIEAAFFSKCWPC
jgi:hypothetical protein